MPAATELLQKGRYRIDSPMTPAGSANVHQAYDTTSDTNVYVKEIVVRLGKVTTLAQQENSRLAFENAARRISEFRHDSLLQVKDFYSEVGRQFLVIESLDGEDLQALLESAGQPFPIENVLDWADQVLDAANYLHLQKPPVIHNNISPRNIKLQANGTVKLLGVTIRDESGNDISTALTESNDGGLNFSPLELIWDDLDAASQKVIINSYDERSEKVLKEPADFRSDIYSIGATLYYLLTAKIPVDPLERSIELLEGNKDPLRSPHSIDSRIAPEISDVVMRALEIKRENRFDSAMIMRQVLRTAVVRIKEREAAEAQEMEEAAEVLRNTQQLRMPEPPALAREPAEPAQPTEAEILAQKLKEAEEMRLEAERRAAEAERLLREQEAEKTRLEQLAKAAVHVSAEPAKPAIIGDDLLEISAEPVHVSNPPAYDDVDDDIHLSVKPEPRAKIDLRTIAKAPEPVKPETARSAEPVVVPEAFNPEPSAAVIEEDESFLLEAEPETHHESEPSVAAYEYSYDEPKRSGPPIAMIAGVAVVVLIVAVVGFVFLGGSSGTPAETQTSAPQQQTQPQAEQPAAVAEQPGVQPEQPMNAFNETPQSEQQAQTEQPTDSRPAAKPAQTPKAKTAEPAKTPAAKKPVTVDDLINDN